MNPAYLLLCGAMWSQYGGEDAGHELIRGLSSPDPELRVLARAMLQQSGVRSKALIAEALAQNEISPVQARLCAFEQSHKSELVRSITRSWKPGAAA